MFEKVLAKLGLLDPIGGGQHRFQAAMLLDKLACCLGTDARHTRDIIDAVPHQRQHIAQQLRRYAELVDDISAIEAAVVHRVEHVDRAVVLDELHQVLVGTDDGHLPTRLARGGGVAGDDVVRLQPLLLDAGDRKRPGRDADQRHLRDKVFWRRRAVRLVLVVHLVAERGGALVEDHRHVGRTVGLAEAFGELPQHRGIAIDRADIHSVAIGQRRQPMIGAEDVARSVDEIEVGLGVRHERAALAGSLRQETPKPDLIPINAA